MVSQWTAEWGPVSRWSRKFQQRYDEAAGTSDAMAAEFLGNVETHVSLGRYILSQLRKVSLGRLPQEGGYIAYVDIWNQSYELMACLHEGIAILEARLDILCPYVPHNINARKYQDIIL
jgi:hypothetical protein